MVIARGARPASQWDVSAGEFSPGLYPIRKREIMTGISPSAMPGGTPGELRERAAAHDRSAHESFERCDTDGFASQWASGIMGDVDRLAAKIAEDNGYHRFPALFDRNGTLVDAWEVNGKFGWVWKVSSPDGSVSWFNESHAQDWRKRIKANARKGYFVGSVLLPARATTGGGSGTGLSGACNVRAIAIPLHTDYRDYVILDNGSASVPEETIRAEYVRTISRHEERSDPDGVRVRVINEQLARAVLWDGI
jgi:hypothetical protein